MKRVKPYPETHQKGIITFEQFMFNRVDPNWRAISGDLGIEIAEDGRIWINVNGVAFLRFKPMSSKLTDTLDRWTKKLEGKFTNLETKYRKGD